MLIKGMTAISAAILAFSTLAHAQSIDFQSADSVRKSIESITADMNEEERQSFSQALVRMIFDRHPVTAGLQGFARLSAASGLGNNLLDGAEDFMGTVTKDDVMREADYYLSLEHQTPKQDTDTEIASVCHLSKVRLSNVALTPSRVLTHLSFDATNEFDVALRGILINYRVMEAGRTVPLIEGEIWASIPSGIEVDETKHVADLEIPLPKREVDLQAQARVIDFTDTDNRSHTTSALYPRQLEWEGNGFAATCPQPALKN